MKFIQKPEALEVQNEMLVLESRGKEKVIVKDGNDVI
jgi:hypothetical protein